MHNKIVSNLAFVCWKLGDVLHTSVRLIKFDLGQAMEVKDKNA